MCDGNDGDSKPDDVEVAPIDGCASVHDESARLCDEARWEYG